jgi:hypothetical protein
MSWLGNLAGELAGALFPGARAIVTKIVDRAVVAVIHAGREFVTAWMNAAHDGSGQSPESTRRTQRSRADDLAQEERELAAKFNRDRARAPKDADRINEINQEREQLRKDIGDTNAVQSAKEIVDADGLISAKTSADELASQVGILSTKVCPTCGGIMTLQFDAHNTSQGQKFKWRCTSARRIPCSSIYVSAAELEDQVSVRKPHNDLDIDEAERKSWSHPDVLAKTAARVRGQIGTVDEAILCPIHLTPMKLLPVANSSGLLLDTYQYACLGVDPNGRACSHTVPVKSFGQVSGLLTRLDGRGIL